MRRMRGIAATVVCAGASLLWAPATLAQQVTSLGNLPAAVSGFENSQAHEPLPCSVHPVKPALNFGFRFQAGYTLETSLDPYVGAEHHWYIVFRVTPENGQPVYFLDSIDVPAPRRADFIAENTGAFQLGEGRYNVKWSLLDDVGRVCRQEWTVDAHLTSGERSERVAMPPDTVGDLSWRPTESANAVAKSRYVTILLNAAIPALRRNGPVVDRWGMLLSVLASLVEQMPEANVRVVAFDPEQQRELFRKDDFTRADMGDVAHVSNARERWAVDYQVLQNPSGKWDFLRVLEDKESHAPSPADTVIFLGVPEARFDKLPPGMPGLQSGTRFFYLQYGFVPSMPRNIVINGMGRGTGRGMGGISPDTMPLAPPGAMVQPDLIEQSVRRLNGKTFVISSPADFSKALAMIRR